MTPLLDLLLEIALQELRQARNLTQEQLAEMLDISQVALSKMEHQSDMQVSYPPPYLSGDGR